MVLNLYKDIFCKVDLLAPLLPLGDIEAIILCSFDFDLKKKNPPACSPASSQKNCEGQPNKQLFFRPYEK